MIRRLVVMVMIAATALLSGCGYNALQSTDEQIKAGWAEVVNQYQRRADLIPNLVETVKGFAAQEPARVCRNRLSAAGRFLFRFRP